ncbi:MAG: magnesium transporter [Alphaproteobacteria bacterium]
MANVEELTEDKKADGDALDELYGLSKDVVVAIEDALEKGENETVHALLEPLHAADIADLLEQLTSGQRESLIAVIGDNLDSEVISYLDYAVREDVVDILNAEQIATIVSDLDSDDAIDFIEDLDEHEQREVLRTIPEEERALYEQSLTYPDDSAGRLMRHEVVTVPLHWTVGDTIDYMRSEESDLPDDFYNIVAVGPSLAPVGLLQLSKLLRTRRPTPVSDVMEADPKLIPVTMDQEDVAFLFRQYGLVEAPVVDEDGRMVGVITVDDIVNVLDEEHEEDILKLGGVQADDFYSDVRKTTRLRFSWLLVNLLTAILASAVIAMFESTLERIVALAILMPIVASMGGNAGTQTLTVAVRALATNELTAGNAMRIIYKEVLVGGVNGILFALLIGGLAWAWFADPMIGLVIASAMIINLLVAGLTGTLVPIALDRIGIDPAIASTVVLTTVTDVVGFFAFLGLAAMILL